MTRVGFIGTGEHARGHAGAFKALGATISACYSTNADKANAFATEYGAKVMNDPLALVSKKEIDILVIAVPPFAHDGQAEMKAIEQRIPFLCEKPVGLDLSLCLKIADGVRKAGLVTSGGYQLRYAPSADEVRPLLARNKLSTVRSCRFGGMPGVHWWRRMEQSGGIMVEQATHRVDFMRYLIGEIRHVYAATASGLAPAKFPGCNIYDSMETVLTFANGMIGSIGTSHLLNNKAPRMELLEVCGQDFYASVGIDKIRFKEGMADWIEKAVGPDNSFAIQDKAFLDAAAAGDPSKVRSSYGDSVKTLAVTLAMNESAATGRPVSL